MCTHNIPMYRLHNFLQSNTNWLVLFINLYFFQHDKRPDNSTRELLASSSASDSDATSALLAFLSDNDSDATSVLLAISSADDNNNYYYYLTRRHQGEQDLVKVIDSTSRQGSTWQVALHCLSECQTQSWWAGLGGAGRPLNPTLRLDPPVAPQWRVYNNYINVYTQ